MIFNHMSITFSTCWYVFKAKFDPSVYKKWIDNFFDLMEQNNNFNLVIYTDEQSLKDVLYFLRVYGKSRVEIINKPFEQFYNYKYKDAFIKNHQQHSQVLNAMMVYDWRVNMLWAEKLHFVKETIDKKYFDTEFYGWCDIGYFRNRPNDTPVSELKEWCNKKAISKLKNNKIYYALVNNDRRYVAALRQLINNKNPNGLPKTPIPPNQISFAGGFFVLHRNLINWWCDTFESKLKLYFDNNYLVKDDQMIITNCIFEDDKNFEYETEDHPVCENWFLFQRKVLT